MKDPLYDFFTSLHICHAQFGRGWGWTSLLVERWTHDQKVTSLNPVRSSRGIFFSSANFVCWFLFVTVHEKSRYKSKIAIWDNAHLKVQTLCCFVLKSDLPNGNKITSVWDNAVLFSVHSSAETNFSQKMSEYLVFSYTVTFGVHSTPVLLQWHIKDPSHCQNCSGRLHPWPNKVGVGWLCRCPGIVCGNLSGNELPHKLSVSTEPQSSQLAEPLWTLCWKSGMGVGERISTEKKKEEEKHRWGMHGRPFSSNPRKQGKSHHHHHHTQFNVYSAQADMLPVFEVRVHFPSRVAEPPLPPALLLQGMGLVTCTSLQMSKFSIMKKKKIICLSLCLNKWI